MENAVDKLISIYSHLASWCVAFASFLCSWLGEGKVFLVYIAIAVMSDLVLGIARSHKAGVGIRSDGFWKAFFKLAVYAFLIVMAVQLDDIIGDKEAIVCTRGISAIIMGSEVWSIISNLAIIFPSVGALSLVKKYLLTEIADKINIDKEILENGLNNNKQD